MSDPDAARLLRPSTPPVTIAADYALDADLTFIRLKMPGWTCMHMIATSATKP
jgi:hypothetical protein